MWDPSSNITLSGVLLLTLAAATWLAFELFPRRRGTTPHCRRCGYNLTGLDAADPAARCPECGALLSRRLAVAAGERRFRAPRLVTAAVLTLFAVPICCTLIYARTTNLDWRRTAPSWVLLRLARGTPVVEADGMLLELKRRFEADLLSAPERIDLAEACLIHHGAGLPNRSTLRIAMDLLGDLLLAGDLTAPQQGRFLDNALAMHTSVREPLVTGMNACVRIAYARRLPSQLTMTVQLRNRTLDGRPCAMAPGPSSWATSGCGADGQFEQVLLMPSAGAHEFAVDAEALLGEKTRPTPQTVSAPSIAGPILLRTRKIATARVNVLEGDPAAFVRPIDTDAAHEAAAALHVAGVLHRPSLSSIDVCVTLLEPCDIWMVFDARLVVEDREIDLGSVSLAPNADPRLWILRARVDNDLPDVVGVELRVNPALARQEALAREFFAGSLSFDVVPVVREQPDGRYFLPGLGPISPKPFDSDCLE